MTEKVALAVLGAILAVIAVIAAATTPLHYEDGFKNVAFTKKATVVTTTTESYGSNPLQVVTLRRDLALNTTPTKTVIFLHGGGWSTGGRGSLEDEAKEWAKTGWVSINVSYRVGTLDGVPDDGKLILEDVLAVLDKYRVKPYVDPNKIIVYGESAGGHLSEWLGSKYGAKVRGFVAISPVSSISGAIAEGQVPGAAANVVALGAKAQEFFGYSVGTTDSHRYLDRVQRAFIAWSTDEWVNPNVHGKKTCLALAAKCEGHEFVGNLHAGSLIDANPQLAVDARHWAGAQLP